MFNTQKKKKTEKKGCLENTNSDKNLMFMTTKNIVHVP